MGLTSVGMMRVRGSSKASWKQHWHWWPHHFHCRRFPSFYQIRIKGGWQKFSHSIQRSLRLLQQHFPFSLNVHSQATSIFIDLMDFFPSFKNQITRYKYKDKLLFTLNLVGCGNISCTDIFDQSSRCCRRGGSRCPDATCVECKCWKGGLSIIRVRRFVSIILICV